MSILYTFIKEIKESKNKKIRILDSTLAEKKAKIQSMKEKSIKEIEEQYSNEAKAKSLREKARIVEAARLKAKKILFDAINVNMDSTFDTITKELKSYTQQPEYKSTLQKMLNYANQTLGSNIKVYCREDDKIILKGMNNMIIGSSIQTIGGILAEDKNGMRELDLTFEELLRTHEDEIKNFLLERMIK
jgi:V/A-type H+/Na+-transporting ATPase subunit E